MSETLLPEAQDRKLRRLATAVYALQALGLVIWPAWVAGAVIDYLEIGEARGTWLETQFNWQLRTFWFGLAAAAIGWLLLAVKIGALVLAGAAVWAVYRIVKGWIALNDGRALALAEAPH
ncbi:MAG: hypothetical protein M5U08_01910 [Burkholderiales bacterium]|nr:hypothetical protein [Burkholderiales bacterium]